MICLRWHTLRIRLADLRGFVGWGGAAGAVGQHTYSSTGQHLLGGIHEATATRAALTLRCLGDGTRLQLGAISHIAMGEGHNIIITYQQNQRNYFSVHNININTLQKAQNQFGCC